MNIKSIFTAAVALILGLTACNKEESLSQDGLPENAVRITATIGNPFATTRSNPVGTVEEQAKFNNEDKILVQSGGSFVTVVYQFNGTTWAPIGNKYHLWANDRETENFYAGYPLDVDGLLIRQVQENQSTLDNLAMSDLMFAVIENAPKGEPLNFVMERLTSRIIINIAGFNPEFPEGSVVTDVRVIDGYRSSDRYTPYANGDGEKHSTYTLLLEPNETSYSSGEFDYYISLKVGEKEMRSAKFPDTERGKSYTFNLIVGKEKLEIGSVTVADWTGKVTLPDGEAGELG